MFWAMIELLIVMVTVVEPILIPPAADDRLVEFLVMVQLLTTRAPCARPAQRLPPVAILAVASSTPLTLARSTCISLSSLAPALVPWLLV